MQNWQYGICRSVRWETSTTEASKTNNTAIPSSSYSQVIPCLLDRRFRQEVVKTIHPKVARASVLDYFELQVDAERSCHHHPWQSDATLGGNHQGYLEVWVKADIAIYISHENKKTGFESRQYVTESAKLIVELGEI